MNKIKISWFGKFIAMLVAFFALSVGANAVPYRLNDVYQYPSSAIFPGSLNGKSTDYYAAPNDSYVAMAVMYHDESYTLKNITIVRTEIKLGIYYYYSDSYTTTQDIYYDVNYIPADSPDYVTIHIYATDFPNNPEVLDLDSVLIHAY